MLQVLLRTEVATVIGAGYIMRGNPHILSFETSANFGPILHHASKIRPTAEILGSDGPIPPAAGSKRQKTARRSTSQQPRKASSGPGRCTSGSLNILSSNLSILSSNLSILTNIYLIPSSKYPRPRPRNHPYQPCRNPLCNRADTSYFRSADSRKNPAAI